MGLEYVYVFVGEKAFIPAAIFSSFDDADQWIRKNKLNGSLNKMPLNISVYDWAIENDFFTPTKDYQKGSKFIQSFTSASMDHWHYDDEDD